MISSNSRMILLLDSILNSIFSHLPKPLQHGLLTLLKRAQDPEPEGSFVELKKRRHVRDVGDVSLGQLPLLALTNAWGTLSVAYAYLASRYITRDVSFFFWLGLLFIFVPSTVRLLSPKASRFERISILCIVGVCLYFVKVMYSPLYLSGYDELLHWLTASNIARSNHLFSTNSLLPVSSDYPGLEIITNAFSTLSGLNIFYAAILVIGVARLVMILSLFLLTEQISNSERIASLATIIYITNSHFLFFDVQFSYESLALPLATCMLFIMVRGEKLKGARHSCAAWLTLGAVVATHHVTDFIFDGFLVLWTLIYACISFTSLRRSHLIQTACFSLLIATIYIVFIAKSVVGYLSSFLSGAFSELGHILVGSSGARHLFVDYGGQPTPLWERIISLSCVGIILLLLPVALLCLWQRYRSHALALMFGVISLLYPFSLAFRFTNAGGEITDRTTAFLFIPISCILAICIAQMWPTRRLTRKQIAFITCILSIMFLGGVIVGSGPPWELVPGRYLVSADQRSIEPEGIETAAWTASYLGPDNRVVADRINQLLMADYGEQRDVTSIEDHVELSPIFFSSSLDSNQIALLRQAKVQYIVVDLRLAYALPRVGFYFDPSEQNAYHYTSPIPQIALTKFNDLPQVNRVYDSGDIVIYDIGGLINAPEKS